MSKFDTHGGYFAPKDYMRINEGGSHEENPNGGVQVGVDEQGVPNMLEEGEPVYKDYVYSDNIKASKRFLEANNIPLKYEGMLYSEIADSIFEEAEERPNDPISKNGLEAMLGRLADSQEQQKEDSERRKLERELSKLSPEELDALQQELMAAEEQAQPQEMVPEQPVVPEGQVPVEKPMEQMTMEQVPAEQSMTIMADGGLLKRFDGGGDTDKPLMFYDEPVSRTAVGNVWKRGLSLPITAGFGLSDAFNPFGIKGWTPINKDHWYHYRTNGRGITGLDIPEINDVDYEGYFDNGDVTVSGGGYPYSYSSGVRSSLRSRSSVPMPDLTEASKDIDTSIKAAAIRDSDFFGLPTGPKISAPVESTAKEKPVGMPVLAPPSEDTKRGSVSGFPTFPRYAGAIGAGLLAAYDAFQEPDKYTATRINPYVPVGHINLQNQRYMPVDQNMIQNQMLAQGNSTQRALRNSGLGPSAGAAILAADNNTTGNLGAGFLQSWQANNHQRNAVIAANNQAEAQRAQFDYAVDAARQRALNEAQIRNAQNDLMLQRLNYGAEGEKYAALSNQLNAGFNALAGIGMENFFRNQANSNTALEGYRTLAGGYGRYLPDYDFWNIGACGGHIKKSKK